MYEFHKNNNGEYTEGFLGEPENFNGIVFLLREPNTGGEPAEEFWFKKVLNDSENYHKSLESSNKEKSKTANSKRDATKFRNRFSEMLEFIDHKENDLKNSVFCNVNCSFAVKSSSFQSLPFGIFILNSTPFSFSFSAILYSATRPAQSLSRHKNTFFIFGLSFSI